MYQHEQLLALREGFFDPAFEPSSGVEMLAHVADCLGAVGPDRHIRKDDVLLCNYMGAQPAALLQEYTERSLDHEPRCQALHGLCPGQLLTGHDVLDAQTMRNHLYYADFTLRAGLGQCIAATPVNDAPILRLHRAPSAGAPSAAMLASVQVMNSGTGFSWQM